MFLGFINLTCLFFDSQIIFSWSFIPLSSFTYFCESLDIFKMACCVFSVIQNRVLWPHEFCIFGKPYIFTSNLLAFYLFCTKEWFEFSCISEIPKMLIYSSWEGLISSSLLTWIHYLLVKLRWRLKSTDDTNKIMDTERWSYKQGWIFSCYDAFHVLLWPWNCGKMNN